MHIRLQVLFTFSTLGAIFQPPAEIHSVELTEWRADAGGNGHFYEAVQAPAGITWDDAEAYATAHGGYLATVTSKEENIFVFKLIDDGSFWLAGPHGDLLGPWLGGVKLPSATKANEGWEWGHGDGTFTYANWNSHQPDNEGGQENRLDFYNENREIRKPEWGDVAGNKPLQGFVVEYDASPLPHSLRYVALFAVCLTGGLVMGTILFIIFRKKPKEHGETAG